MIRPFRISVLNVNERHHDSNQRSGNSFQENMAIGDAITELLDSLGLSDNNVVSVFPTESGLQCRDWIVSVRMDVGR